MGKLIEKIVIVGNAGGGKTTLSRKLASFHNLPLIHVDSIQFLPGMKIRHFPESIKMLIEIQDQSAWIIDGYGPLDIIEKRFERADRIVFIDFPLWRHYWWCAKRQVQNFWSRRIELPEGCSELSWSHTLKLFRSLSIVHRQMRPELLRIFTRPKNANKVIFVRNLKEWNHLYRNGIVEI